MNDKIVKEVAEQEFQRFVDAMDLDVNTEGLGQEDKDSLVQQRNLIVRSIQSGSLIVNDDGEPVFTPQRTNDADAITFHEPTGASLMAMDRKKKAEDIGKLYATMADMTKVPSKTFANMKMPDLKVCMAITTLFLG